MPFFGHIHGFIITILIAMLAFNRDQVISKCKLRNEKDENENGNFIGNAQHN